MREQLMDAQTYELLRTAVRRFVNERLVPNEDRVEGEDCVPQEIVAEMRELGLFGLAVFGIPLRLRRLRMFSGWLSAHSTSQRTLGWATRKRL